MPDIQDPLSPNLFAMSEILNKTNEPDIVKELLKKGYSPADVLLIISRSKKIYKIPQFSN